jgi:acetoin utilization deacetylase AcuC-like enzyme
MASSVLRSLRRTWASWRGPGRLKVWYHPSFRLPITSLNARHGLEVRRADYTAWYLTIDGWLHPEDLVVPEPVSYADMARVHTEALLESLTHGDGLAAVFHADRTELRVDEVMHSIRRACGATLEAARDALATGKPSLSLLGGFHHAFPDKAGGLCPVNDIAVAIAALRAEGFAGQVVVLDLDAHPPDGTAACLVDDERAWIGSISGSDWGPLPRVDETVLQVGSADQVYLAALHDLLLRMPRSELAFVIAGGDVIAGDRMGQLAMTAGGVRRRDLAVAQALRGIGSVWVPGGGYTEQSWRILSGTALALAGYGTHPITARIDPTDLRFDRVARHLDPAMLGGAPDDDWLDSRALEVELGVRPASDGRLLGFYTREGVEYAFAAYGILEQLERLGYHGFRFDIDAVALGDQLRLYGRDEHEVEHLLGETVVRLKEVEGRPVIFVHWLTLRHPAGTFGAARPRLPGQEVPGLGLSMEAVELLERAAKRIQAAGIAFRPSYFHTAWPSTERVRFVDDARQGRFEALLRDLGALPKYELTQALAEGRVRLNGGPYTWEPDDMVYWLDKRAADEPGVDAERERVRFTVVPAEAAS